jgi:TRAP-type C4-dicarboxylate transport system permease small subunit
MADRGAATDDDPRRSPPPALRRVAAGISAAERFVGALILSILLLLVLVQTGVRFLPFGGWVWTGELARFCLVWLTFALSGYLMGRDGHITLELVDYVAGGRALWGVRAFANVVIAVICAGFAVESLAMITEDTGQASPAMELPLPLVYVIPLVGFVLTAVRAALAVIWRPPAGSSALGPHGAGPADDRDAPPVLPGGSAT